MTPLSLAFDVAFEDLYNTKGLIQLDQTFLSFLSASDASLCESLLTARQAEAIPTGKEESELLLAIAPYLEDFIAELFGVQTELKELTDQHHKLANVFWCKRQFVQRYAVKKYKPADVMSVDGKALREQLVAWNADPSDEITFANTVHTWQQDLEHQQERYDVAAQYTAWAIQTREGVAKHHKGVLFKLPKKLQPDALVDTKSESFYHATQHQTPHNARYRDGFKLTDEGATLIQALDDANYCIICHKQGKDSCSKGMKEKDHSTFKTNDHGITLAGCPLEEKISEMNQLKSDGIPIAALAMITVDNPLCAATGHRICNDCMKSCIFQKQQPVNIPHTETRSLQDILELPWGFEIYSLLTRWNPLNLRNPLPKPDTGYKILVAGLGPAGFTLSHYLLNEGHTVVAVDGLKIEPLPPELTALNPIRNIESLFESLDERVLAGFGGVAEYGITVRWNKNYLKIIRLLLERRSHFTLFGGVRFGSTITYDDAWELGFDHVALALGAGKPTVIDIPNAMARGVRTASDFLMSLQLTGAAKKDSIANLQLRLPVVVIGGGLTAIDTATETLAYYPVQVEKFLTRYEKLCLETSQEQVRSHWDAEAQAIADEYIAHAKAIRAERQKATEEQRDPDILSLLNQWGGARVIYRKRLQDSPAYRLNHEEVELALEEGIHFVENATPLAVELDKHHHANALRVRINNQEESLPASSVFMAAGTSPNTVLQREDAEHFSLDGKYFQAINRHGEMVTPDYALSKPDTPHVLLHRTNSNQFISFFGDLHPSYFGNVVKAMGSAKQGYGVVSEVLSTLPPTNTQTTEAFFDTLTNEWQARVHAVYRLTPSIIEVVIHAPAAARHFQPGQFYRLQNHETHALRTADTTLAMEGLALTGASVDQERGLLSTIVLEMGGSGDLCTYLKEGEPVILMGPTGTPTEIVARETVLLIGGGLGNAVLFSIGKALREAGSKVLYFAGYKKPEDRYKTEEIEAACDAVIWACDTETLPANRPQDRTYHGNIVDAMLAHAKGELGETSISLDAIDRMIVIGSDRMMNAVAGARHGLLREYLKPDHVAIGSINSPMQCMMKEICAQCLQKHIDPKTGLERYVYSCFNQDQPLDTVCFSHLSERLKQNHVHEPMTAQWIDYCLKSLELRERTDAA